MPEIKVFKQCLENIKVNNMKPVWFYNFMTLFYKSINIPPKFWVLE